MDERLKYKRQQKLSFAQFLAEIPNFIALSVSVLLTGSLIVWMDFIDSLGNVLRTGMVALLTKRLSKDLRYEYNYGVEKIEDIAVLFCDGIVLCSLAVAVGSAVHELTAPRQPSGLLAAVVGLKVVNTTLDAIFLRGQYRLRKADSGMLAGSAYTAAVGMLLFDALALLSLLLVWALKNHAWSWYFSPVIGILLALYLGYKCIGRLRKAVYELTDKTLPEEEQLKILKVITRHYDKYSAVHFVKSHKLGNKAHIDLVLSFPDDSRYSEMIALKNTLRDELSELIRDCTVNISIE